jgi:predicted amidophosphoribosyltransferase
MDIIQRTIQHAYKYKTAKNVVMYLEEPKHIEREKIKFKTCNVCVPLHTQITLQRKYEINQQLANESSITTGKIA